MSPAWRCNDTTLTLQETYGMDYAGDCRGHATFYPIVDGNILTTLQIPTTLPTVDELLGIDGRSPDEVNSQLWDLIREDALNVYALHTEVEGGLWADSFESFLRVLRYREIVTCTHADLVSKYKNHKYPACTIGRRDIPGCSGWVSLPTQIS